MNRLEEELKSALARREPAPGFEQRVMARLPQRGSGWSPQWLRAVAALVIAAFLAGAYQYRETRRARAEAAKAELFYALQLTAEKLQNVQSKVVRKQVGGEL